MYSFEKLQVWQEARELTKTLYLITANFPNEEKFNLVSQIRRASISIISNIAEGTGRTSAKDKANFYQMAYSSNIEVLNQIIITNDLNYIDEQTYLKIRTKIDSISSKISALRNVTLNPKP